MDPATRSRPCTPRLTHEIGTPDPHPDYQFRKCEISEMSLETPIHLIYAVGVGGSHRFYSIGDRPFSRQNGPRADKYDYYYSYVLLSLTVITANIITITIII